MKRNFFSLKKYYTSKKIQKRNFLAFLATVNIFYTLLYTSEDYYLVIKTIHFISVICWMAGMLYLPRIFVYHCISEQESIQSAIFKTMENRLLLYIINPSMILTWSSGLWMAWKIYHLHGGWLHLKLVLVILLSTFHGFLIYAVYKFKNDKNQFSEKTWRILNEVPTLLMIVIVIVVVFKIPI